MIPKTLKIQNFLSHDTSEIDFDKFNAALILGAYDNEADQSNGAGKSAIFEAIAWALFGRSRHKKVDGVVKWDKRACRVELAFWIDDELYRVIRTRDKIVSGADVVLEQWDGTQFNSIDCDTNTATDKKIVGIINFNYEVFVNSVYFKQDDISMFATTTPSKRKDVLKSLLKMDKWDAYQKKAKEHTSTLKNKIEEKSQSLVPMIEIESELKNCKGSINSLKKQIRDGNKKYTKLNSDLITKKSQYQSYYNGDDDVHGKLKKTQRDFANAKKRMAAIDGEVKDNDSVIRNNSNQTANGEQKIVVLTGRIKAKNKAKTDSLKNKILFGKTKENMLSEQIAHLKKDIKLNDDKCDLCSKKLTKKEISDLKAQRKKDLVDKEQTHKKIQDELKRANQTLKSRENDIEVGNKAELEKSKMQIKISKLQNEIDNCIASNSRLTSERATIKPQIFQKEIAELKLRADKDAKKELEVDIGFLETELKELKRKGDRYNVDYGSKIRRRNEIVNLQKQQAELQSTINTLKGEYSVYSKLKNYFGKDGVQSIIIENVIEELENYSNDTLAKICNEPTSISIQTQKQLDSGSWTETFEIMVKAGSRTDDFDTFSGGEKFRISLALRLALSNILSKRMGGIIKFLLLDEVSSNLDNKGLEMFINIVKQLSDEMKILVITHSERLKERFEDIIMVDKGPNGSRVSFQ